MKIRQCFVSNSSSSSFIIATSVLSEKQIEKLLAYNDSGQHDGWSLKHDKDAHLITGFTCMDNGDLKQYIEEECGINPRLVKFIGD